jgi:hypothetical protein
MSSSCDIFSLILRSSFAHYEFIAHSPCPRHKVCCAHVEIAYAERNMSSAYALMFRSEFSPLAANPPNLSFRGDLDPAGTISSPFRSNE